MTLPSDEHDKVLLERARGGGTIDERWIMLLASGALIAIVVGIAATFT